MNLYTYVENNPINWIDPFGLYRSEVHKDLTNRLVRDTFGDDYGWGDAVNDYDKGWTSPWWPWSGPSHFRNTSDVEADLENALEQCNEKAFQNLLHQLQDSYSQGKYSYWTGGHILDTLFGNDPDKYDPTSQRDKNMKRKTRKWIEKWCKKWRKKKKGS